ncbi:hypothetical protein SERLADRAFT_404534 [Serpula lacrymans var. lacrymans S7.9]|uniref:Uncharacterized protein n=1 Tax=Serpula lacrymans var. lacrymans (strain S7.9) TaxID=578457 RepID=F8NDF9_SERL9|nr:uncharacterized protein SERLADRAFT_404534 [Serpula lacrymans var. lacrymans S7.9]EGO30297.1 hypothetical protein SERLADRAFT_404534 [Serpula lacrymans var. lacrymans S7.9]
MNNMRAEIETFKRELMELEGSTHTLYTRLAKATKKRSNGVATNKKGKWAVQQEEKNKNKEKTLDCTQEQYNRNKVKDSNKANAGEGDRESQEGQEHTNGTVYGGDKNREKKIRMKGLGLMTTKTGEIVHADNEMGMDDAAVIPETAKKPERGNIKADGVIGLQHQNSTFKGVVKGGGSSEAASSVPGGNRQQTHAQKQFNMVENGKKRSVDEIEILSNNKHSDGGMKMKEPKKGKEKRWQGQQWIKE